MSQAWYYRRDNGQTIRSRSLDRVFADWKGAENERWLLLAPHDDDIVIGAGMTAIAAAQAGVTVYAAVTTDGRMGYCNKSQLRTISDIRRQETTEAFEILGILEKNLTWLGYPDCNLTMFRGRRFETVGYPTIENIASGLQNSYTRILRKCRPTRVFIPALTDLHPDHQLVHREMLISLFHAQGNIWPELGTPLAEVPQVYEYACYCDFFDTPDYRIEGTQEMLQKKLDSIAAYRSQEQIATIVEGMRAAGPSEYFRAYPFRFYNPLSYESAFANAETIDD